MSQQTGKQDQEQPPQHSNKQVQPAVAQQQKHHMPAVSIMADLRRAQEGHPHSSHLGFGASQAQNSSGLLNDIKWQPLLDNRRHCRSSITFDTSTAGLGESSHDRMQQHSLSQPADWHFLTAGIVRRRWQGPCGGGVAQPLADMTQPSPSSRVTARSSSCSSQLPLLICAHQLCRSGRGQSSVLMLLPGLKGTPHCTPRMTPSSPLRRSLTTLHSTSSSRCRLMRVRM